MHEGYLPSHQMALEGQCCTHANDCMSGICIGGACWAPLNSAEIEQEHILKAALVCAVILAFLVCAFLCSCCCLRSLKVNVKVKAPSRDWDRNAPHHAKELESQRHELTDKKYLEQAGRGSDLHVEIDAEIYSDKL